MKAARLRITTQALANILELPEKAEIVLAFQDPEDMACSCVSIIVRGAGEECCEGSSIKVMSLDDVRGNPEAPPSLDMGVQRLHPFTCETIE